MHLVLDLTDKYPHDSLDAHILDCVVHFLPSLVCSCTRRGRVKIISNVKRFVLYPDSSSVHGTLCEEGNSPKVNQTVTSNYLPNADPINIDLLRGKYPEPAHPDRDPVCLTSIFRSRSQNLEEYWSSDVGTEFLDKWFSIG